MMANSQQNTDLLHEFGQRLRELLDALQQLPLERLGIELEPLEWYRILRQHARELARDSLPVVALIGPTGAGKSTLFRLLTGVEVPAGGARRPCSFNLVVAVSAENPEQALPEEELRLAFREFQLRPLEHPDDLKQQGLEHNTLFYCRMSPEATAARENYVLVDVPDFGSFVQANWNKAELMLERAEAVIFVAYQEAYANHEVLRYLSRATALAGFLVYLLTKTDAEVAEEVRQHLYEEVIDEFDATLDDENADLSFQQQRADGLTRLEFLRQCFFYYSERSSQPRFEDIQALDPEVPSLSRFLRGRNLEKLALCKRANDLIEGLRFSDDVLQQLEQRRSQLQQLQARVEQDVEQLDFLSAQVKGEPAVRFPLGEVLHRILNVVDEEVPMWRRVITGNIAVKWIRQSTERLFRNVHATAQRLLARKHEVPAFDRERVEQRELRNRVDRLARLWLSEHRETVELSLEHFNASVVRFREKPIEPPSSEWDEFLTEKTREWVREHPNKAMLVLFAQPTIAMLGVGLVTADIVFTGGGISLLVTGAPAFSGIMPNFLARLGLEPLLEQTLEKWQETRNQQLQAHFREHFVGPFILNRVKSELQEIDDSPRHDCEQSTRALRQLLTRARDVLGEEQGAS